MHFNSIKLFLLVFILSLKINYSQKLLTDSISNSNYIDTLEKKTNLTKPSVNYGRLAIIGGSIFAINGGLWLYYDEAWYKGTRTKFHLYDDWYNGNLNVDKLGHMHYAMIQNRVGYRAFRWAGFNDDWSMWIASGLGWLLHLQVELEDAKYAEWGFSLGDLGANTLGAIYPNLQRYFPFFSNFNLKLSYYPSKNYLDGTVKHIINDYEGRTYWLTVNIYGLYPGIFKDIIPQWLNLAIGYGGDKIYNEQGRLRQIGKRGIGTQQWYLALDYDLLKLFNPAKDSFWHLLLEQLDQFHFPAPAIMLKPRKTFYLMFISD